MAPETETAVCYSQCHISLKKKAKQAYCSLLIVYNCSEVDLCKQNRKTSSVWCKTVRKRDGQSAVGAIPVQRLNTGIAPSSSHV